MPRGYTEDSWEQERAARKDAERSFYKKVILGVASAFALIVCLLNSPFYIVNQGEVAVVTRFGSIVSVQRAGGIKFKVPFIDKANRISVQQQTYTYDKMQAYSADQQPADLKVSVTIRATNPESLYVNYRTEDSFVERVVSPRIPQALKATFGKFNAQSSIQNRAKLDFDVLEAIRASVGTSPVIVDAVQIENIDFSDAYEQAVEKQMQAQVNQRSAEAQAARTKTLAEADSYAARVRGEGQAAAIKARGDALRENPGIPALVAAEKWDGKLPTSMPPNSAVPFLSLGR